MELILKNLEFLLFICKYSSYSGVIVLFKSQNTTVILLKTPRAA